MAVSVLADPPPPPAAPVPGLAPVAVPVAPPTPLAQETIAAGGQLYAGATQWARSLPFYGDDYARDFGADLWARVGRDPQVASASGVIVEATLAHPVELLPPDLDTGLPDALVQDVFTYCERMLADLTPTPETLLHEMLGTAMQNGHCLGEKIYTLQDVLPGYGPLWQLAYVKPKPLTAYAWVVDPYNNVLGVIPQRPGRPLLTPTFVLADIPPEWGFLGMEHLAPLTWGSHVGDPRGQSGYIPIYGFWWEKQQYLVSLRLWVTQFGAPNVVVVMPPNAGTASTDLNGQPVAAGTSPAQQYAAVAAALRGNGYTVVPYGTIVDLKEAHSQGAAILHAIEGANAEIIKGLTGQSLGTDQGMHSSRAQANVHQDILGLRIRYAKHLCADFVRNAWLKPAIRINFGAAAVAATPVVSLGQTEPQDQAAILQAIAQLNSPGGTSYFAGSQLQALDARSGLPVRTAAEAAAWLPTAPPTPTEATDADAGGVMGGGQMA
jgi:hypothetical protein